MGIFSKKADPISGKAKSLNDQIAALETEIKQLNAQLDSPPPPQAPEPRPARTTSTPQPTRSIPAKPIPHRDPIFESVHQGPPAAQTENAPGHFNDLGVRKYDLPGAWRRLLNFFRGPSAHNPKLVSYLAAGSIRGLRPLRYEKRIARNRFILLTLFFLWILWWGLAVLLRHR